MSSEEGADACTIHDGFLQALLHLQNNCGYSNYGNRQPFDKRCTCSLHRILIKVFIFFLFFRQPVEEVHALRLWAPLRTFLQQTTPYHLCTYIAFVQIPIRIEVFSVNEIKIKIIKKQKSDLVIF